MWLLKNAWEVSLLENWVKATVVHWHKQLYFHLSCKLYESLWRHLGHPLGHLALSLPFWHIVFAIVRPQKGADIKLVEGRGHQTVQNTHKFNRGKFSRIHLWLWQSRLHHKVHTLMPHILNKSEFPLLKTWAHKEPQTKEWNSMSRGAAASEKSVQNSNKKMTQNKNNFISTSRYQFLFFFFSRFVPIPLKNGFDIVYAQSVGPVATKSLRTHEYRVKHTSIYCFRIFLGHKDRVIKLIIHTCP